MGWVLMSEREVHRVEVLSCVVARRMSTSEAASVLCLSERQVQRLLRTFREDGAVALRHKARGRPSNNRKLDGLRGLAMALVREGNHSRQRIGACADQPVRHLGKGHARVPSEVRQWPGLHQPSLHRAGPKLRPEARVHHAPLPAAERHGRACDPDTERTVHPSPALRQHPARDASHRRLDQLLQQPTPASGAGHEDPR